MERIGKPIITVKNVSKVYSVWDKPSHRFTYPIYKKLGKTRFLSRVLSGFCDKIENRRNDFYALNDVSFEVYKGQSVGILGRNGSGKSTLLQIIAGTLQPTSGSVEVHGRVAALLELGSGFNPEFTGKENVYLNGAVLGISKKEMDERYDQILEFADIGDFVDQPIKTYSSGMVLRLAFAVQILVDPDILIVDEALSVGDSLFQKRCFQRINSLVENGTTLLFVSHHEDAVRTLTSQALFLDHGNVRAKGQSPEIVLEYRRFLHQQEKSYLDSVARSLEKSKSDNIASTPTESVSNGSEFGDYDAYIKSVRIFGEDGSEKNVAYAGETICIKVGCVSTKQITHLNIGLRIRNKEGIKMYSWGTLNQDLYRGDGLCTDDSIWNRQFEAGECFEINFKFSNTLGPNFYEIQAYIAEEVTPDFHSQRMLHWRDEAAFLNVGLERERYFFGGVSDLRMIAEFVLGES